MWQNSQSDDGGRSTEEEEEDALGYITICLPQNPINLSVNNAQEQLN